MRSILSLFLILLFGCEVEPYEPACVQGEYIHGHLCTEEYAPVVTRWYNICKCLLCVQRWLGITMCNRR